MAWTLAAFWSYRSVLIQPADEAQAEHKQPKLVGVCYLVVENVLGLSVARRVIKFECGAISNELSEVLRASGVEREQPRSIRVSPSNGLPK